jgi:hypothetical protein
MAGGKKQRIRLESKIQHLLHKDNGVSAHFDYRIHMNSRKNTVELHLLTFNAVYDDYMLLHKVAGKSSIDCLTEMLDYLEKENRSKVEYSFTIEWKRKDREEEAYQSYFRATSEKEALEKFLHEKKASDYFYTVKMNPIT